MTARSRKVTIVLDSAMDSRLKRAAREQGISPTEFIRQQLHLVLEQYRRHPQPRSAGIVRVLTNRSGENSPLPDHRR
jgi:hypothetical protein